MRKNNYVTIEGLAHDSISFSCELSANLWLRGTTSFESMESQPQQFINRCYHLM